MRSYDVSVTGRFLIVPFVLSAAMHAGCSTGSAPAEPAKGPTALHAPQAPPDCPSGRTWNGKECAAAPALALPAASAATPAPPANAAVAPAPEPVKANAPSSGGCPAGMALVPGGSFVMGPLKEQFNVGSFCMDLTEVTAADYAACAKGGACNTHFVKCADAKTYEAPGKENHPMVCVDFAQATAYCKAQGKRLPREEEWEWAARGGTEGRIYPWGETAPADQVCWSGGGTVRTGTCAVGSFPAGDNPQGIHDLAGNVFEWTTSKNDAQSKQRIGRGGSWRDGIPSMMRGARPGGFEPTYRCGFLGIRCVTEAPGEATAPAP